jgi:hypothetical protein
VIVYL